MSRFEGRTEKPSERRRRKARREGQTARSAEVPIALSFGGAFLCVRVFVPGVIHSFIGGMQTILAATASPAPGSVVRQVALGMAEAGVMPFLAVATVLALAGGFGQTGFTFAPGALKPKLSNLSPTKGLQRLKPSTMGWEGVRSLVKMALATLVVYGPIRAVMARSATLTGLPQWLSFTGTQAASMLIRFALLSAVLAGADFGVTKHRTSRGLKMTKQETRQEHKEEEGDPLIRSQRRRRHLEISRRNMLREVERADVVLVNPTHLAVALRYDAGEPAPRVVAKGSGELALKMRSTAYRHGVMVREDKPLARAIFQRCKVGHFVPAALFEAVAVVLAAAYRRRRKGAL